MGPPALDGTKLFLQNGYNIDVTSSSGNCFFLLPLVPYADEWGCHHSRPYRFYGQSVNSLFVGSAADKTRDSIVGTAGMGFALSVEKARVLPDLQILYPKRGKCVMNGDTCNPVSPPISVSYVLPFQAANTIFNSAGNVNYRPGGTTSLNVFDSLDLGSPSLAASSSATLAKTSSTSTSEAPSWITVQATTSEPVNTLRFDWVFASAGEGLLRVYVDDNPVRTIDQRYVPPASLATEEVYIGGDNGTLEPGTQKIAFRLDGFGANSSGVELTNVSLWFVTINSTVPTPPLATLDIDGSSTATKYDALTDGVLAIRYMFGLTGAPLTAGALGSTPTTRDAAAIKTYLDANRSAFDIDGDGNDRRTVR